ncbi:serine hydrolase domain-containing protein [uncultured Amnibacterium sp.]|uniref:serine hydrolase domain-containing protein n=1 Tax=uncultured Amnibacterium sp. TaxID=1631851 RepID=UPI0035CBA72C
METSTPAAIGTGIDLPVGTPSEQGVDARGIEAFIDALETDPAVDPHGVIVLRHGTVIAEGFWAPYTADRIRLVYSVSKTFTVTALGFAVAEGLLGLDDAVVDHFPEFADEVTGPRSRRILIRHLAAMASGHAVDMLERSVVADPREPIRGFLLQEPEFEPGTHFTYNQLCTYTIGAIIQRATGLGLTEYLRPRLLDPLGIGPVGWQQYPPGRDLGFSGLHTTAGSIAELGQLYLQDGGWQGRQLLPEGWAEQVRARHVETPNEQDDWGLGYGFQVWLSRYGYRADGAFGQLCLILPEQDAVVMVTSATDSAQAVLTAAWQHLIPAFDAAIDSTDDAPMARRLAGLTAPTTAAEPGPADSAGWAGAFSPAIAPGDFGLTTVEVDHDDGWHVTLGDGRRTARLPLGAPGWTTVEATDLPAIAVASGWTGPDTAGLDVALLETPHRLTIRLQRGSRTFTTRWATVPLPGTAPSTLFDLASPRPLR